MKSVKKRDGQRCPLCFCLAVLLILNGVFLAGCSKTAGEEFPRQEITPPVQEATPTASMENEGDNAMTDYAELFKDIRLKTGEKIGTFSNPLMTQRFGADPYAMVYEDTLYIYMTGDEPMYTPEGELKENTYANIDTINVISSKDMVNWTDHGSIKAASLNGAAKWARNSWAPAATWKMIDGKPKFFLYFANSGGGIGVLTADSPVGPFVDPIGKELVSKQTPTCAEVLWLFDPAVLIDDDGSAYLYFGGGVPEGKAENPATARVVKLGDDMISLAGDPVVIEPPFLFEDSGINKIGDTYYYSYCSNFSVTPEGTEKYGMKNGEICYMTSDSPMGPFTYQGMILQNPEKFFGIGGNNHHCIFEFGGEWFITYHARMQEKDMKMNGGYRSTHIDRITINEDGSIATGKATRSGVTQKGKLNPYEKVEAETIAFMYGVSTTAGDDTCRECGSGNMVVSEIETGDWICVRGVDFGDAGATQVLAAFACKEGQEGAVEIHLDSLRGEVAGYIPVEANESGMLKEVTSELLKTVTGEHDVYFILAGSGYTWDYWQFK